MNRTSLSALMMILALGVAWLVACSGGDDDDDSQDAADDDAATDDDMANDDTSQDDDLSGDDDTFSGEFTLVSSAFADGQPIPDKYTCHGADVSPPLQWFNAPEDTAAFSIFLLDESCDPPCPHWGLINLPPDATSIAEGLSGGDLPGDGWETLNYTDQVGYAGPCPPQKHPAHNYYFTIYAMNATFNPGTEMTIEDALPVVQSYMLNSAQLLGTYDW